VLQPIQGARTSWNCREKEKSELTVVLSEDVVLSSSEVVFKVGFREPWSHHPVDGSGRNGSGNNGK
jgi:hypothetical protein